MLSKTKTRVKKFYSLFSTRFLHVESPRAAALHLVHRFNLYLLTLNWLKQSTDKEDTSSLFLLCARLKITRVSKNKKKEEKRGVYQR